MSYDYSVHYKRFHDESETHANEMAEWLHSYLQEDFPSEHEMPVLDIGCGFGFALRALRKAGFTDVRGLETSSAQAEIARRAGFEVQVVSNTADYLRNYPSHFGLILLLDVLEHVPVSAQINLLSAIQTSLQPNGRLILTVPNANSPLASRWRYIDFTHFNSFTEHSLFFVLRNGGFGKIEMDKSKGIGPFPKRWWQSDRRAALRKWLVRFIWLQLFKAELHPSESLEDICFELNLKAVAFNTNGTGES